MNDDAEQLFDEVTMNDLGRLRRYVHETATALGCDPPAVDELVVAVNEAAANIVRHAYKNQPGRISVLVISGQEMCRVILLDSGPFFNPLLAPSPDTTLPLSERPLGGMGIHMMRAFCDELSYRRTPEGENELTLSKRITVR